MKTQRTDVVPVTTLDLWAQDENVSRCSFVKLDLQGQELAALQGGAGLLSSGVQVVLTEVNFEERYSGAPLFPAVASFLSEFGFRLHRLYEVVSAANGSWQHADALFVSDSLRRQVQNNA
jgi:hypothetical protein